MDVGGALRDAREQRGLSLDQLARATKIRVTTLQAIETNRREKLPEAIFLRGFVRAYAREVGLNPEDTVRQYLGQFEPVTPMVESAKPMPGEVRAEYEPAVGGETGRDQPARRVTPVQWIGIVIVLIISVAAYYTMSRWRAPQPPPTPLPPLASAIEIAGSSSPAASSTAAAAGRPEAATAGSHALTRPATKEGDVLEVDIRPQGLRWIAATVDGTRVLYRLMQPGEQQTIEVHDEAVLRVGNPAAFAFSINDMPGRSLGRAGEAVTVHITRENYREFLRR